MAYKLEFELQGLPRMTNASGRSKHWALLAKEADKWKKAVVCECIFKRQLHSPALYKAKLTLTRYSSVSPDPDGLVSSFKHVIDGLVLGGVIVNDRFENISMPDYRWVKCKPKEGKIHVVVESVDSGDGK